jgi:two-component system CheB/CheR fusion protein
VVAIHLGADHESHLAQVLQRCTRMPVQQGAGPLKVEADHVYVIPPRQDGAVAEGDWLDCTSWARRGRHVTVDLFFRTLADSHGPHSAAIVLSGRRRRRHRHQAHQGTRRPDHRAGPGGGAARQHAAHRHRHRHGRLGAAGAGHAGAAAVVLPARAAVELPPEEPPSRRPPRRGAAGGGRLREVLTFLRTRTGRDFTGYKRATIVRRIGRRMQVNGTDNLGATSTACARGPARRGAAAGPADQRHQLLPRPDCFAALQPHIPALFEARARTTWCGSGWPAAPPARRPTAGHAAVRARAHAGRAAADPGVRHRPRRGGGPQVGARGVYPHTIEADVSEERLRRYFTREHRGYRVRREVREMVLFAQHDVLKDSPFSRLDLVSCRNLLIYLTRESQQRVFETFHFALRPRALLFLGASESATKPARCSAWPTRSTASTCSGRHPRRPDAAAAAASAPQRALERSPARAATGR